MTKYGTRNRFKNPVTVLGNASMVFRGSKTAHVFTFTHEASTEKTSQALQLPCDCHLTFLNHSTARRSSFRPTVLSKLCTGRRQLIIAHCTYFSATQLAVYNQTYSASLYLVLSAQFSLNSQPQLRFLRCRRTSGANCVAEMMLHGPTGHR